MEILRTKQEAGSTSCPLRVASAGGLDIKVSIITVSYNSVSTIGDTIESVQGQSYAPVEHIFIDGGSTDGTVSQVQSRIRNCDILVSEPDKGIYNAMNKGVHLASGEIIGILNADDFYYSEEVIDHVVETFHKTGCDAVYGNMDFVCEHAPERIVRHWQSTAYKRGSFRFGWHPPHPTFFVKKEVYERFGDFDQSFRISADFDLMLRFIEVHQVKVEFMDEALVYMRYGGVSTKSLKNMIIGNIEVMKSLKKNNIPLSPFYPLYRLLPKVKQFFPGHIRCTVCHSPRVFGRPKSCLNPKSCPKPVHRRVCNKRG